MIQLVFARHVAESAKVAVATFDAFPSHASELKTTGTAHDAVVLYTLRGKEEETQCEPDSVCELQAS